MSIQCKETALLQGLTGAIHAARSCVGSDLLGKKKHPHFYDANVTHRPEIGIKIKRTHLDREIVAASAVVT